MTKGKAVRAISFLWLGSLLGAGCAFLAQVLLARVLGKSDFGVFASALATVTLMVPLAGFGVAPFWLKVFGEEGWHARRWWRGSFRFVAGSTVLVMFFLALWGGLGPHDERTQLVLLLLLSYVLGQVVLELVSSKLQLEEKYLALAIWQFLPHFSRFALVAAGALLFSQMFSVYIAAAAYSVVSVVFFITGVYVLLVMRRGSFDLQGHGNSGSVKHIAEPSALKVAAESWPFGAAGVFYLVYFQSAVILLNYLAGSSAAGLYNTAFIIMAAVYLFPSVIYQKFLLPKIHRWAQSDRSMLWVTVQQGNRYMLGFGLLAMVALWLGGWWAIPFLFGEEYRPSVWVLNILAFAAPARFVASSVGSVLATKDNMKRKVRYMGAVGIFNVGLNVALIPAYGIWGAAVAAVVSDFLLLALYFVAVRKYVFGKEVT